MIASAFDGRALLIVLAVLAAVGYVLPVAAGKPQKPPRETRDVQPGERGGSPR